MAQATVDDRPRIDEPEEDLLTRQLSRKNYRWITLCLFILFVGLTVLAVAGAVPAFVGTIAFLVAIAWVLYGFWFVEP